VQFGNGLKDVRATVKAEFLGGLATVCCEIVPARVLLTEERAVANQPLSDPMSATAIPVPENSSRDFYPAPSIKRLSSAPVSYTHLTLPTILRV